MSNTVKNYLLVEGAQDRINELRKVANHDGKIFSFKGFKPVPKKIEGSPYEWCHRNWGTVTDAFGAAVVDRNLTYFKTNWNPPIELFRTAAKQFNDLKLTLSWIEEYTESAGTVIFKGGGVISLESEPTEDYEAKNSGLIHSLNMKHQKEDYISYLESMVFFTNSETYPYYLEKALKGI